MDEDTTPIYGQARFGRPYLKVGAVVALAAGILALGYLGPRPTPPPASSPTASLLARAPTAAPTAAQPGAPADEVAPPGTPLSGLTPVSLADSDVKQSWLPGQITSTSMAILGQRLFYIVSGDQIQATEVGAALPPQTLVSVSRCHGISQLAAAGHELAYVVTSPGGPTAQVTNCGGAASVSWSVWLLDLNSGRPRQVADGVRAASSIGVAEVPVHLALTDSAYAFSRPPSSVGADMGDAVEVHALDSRLLWVSRAQQPVVDVMLGGGTLAFLTHGSLALGVANLYVSDQAHPNPSPVDQPASSASLSPDGMYLTWDVAYQGSFPRPDPSADVAVETVQSGVEIPLTTSTNRIAPAPLRPTISTTDQGMLVTWFATGSGGKVYPAARYTSGGSGAFLPSLQEPVWMTVAGGKLFWVAESVDGWSKVAFVVDLAKLGLT